MCITHNPRNHKCVTRVGILLVVITKVTKIIALPFNVFLSWTLIIHLLKSNSSSHSDEFVIKDCNDDGHQENESDITTTSYTITISIESHCSIRSGNSAVPFLSVFKALDMSKLWKVAKNPPTSKNSVHSTNSQSNPKRIKPQQRVREYPSETFTVSYGKLFSQKCREELPLNKTGISYHIKSSKHSNGKKVWAIGATQSWRSRYCTITNDEIHGRGETLPEQQVFHDKAVKKFLQAGLPLSKVGYFQELLEETGYHLTDRRHLFDLMPFILEE